MEKTKKHLNFLFINTAPESTSPVWSRIGKSTEWTDTMNAATVTYDYIEDSAPTDELQNYKPTTSMPLTAYIGDPVYDYVFGLYNNQTIGTDAVTQALRVFQSKKDGKNIAQKTEVLVTIENYAFATGIITFIISQRGTPEPGTADITVTDADGVKKYAPVFTKE